MEEYYILKNIQSLSGPLPFRMTSDILFKILLQKNDTILRAIVCAYLNVKGAAHIGFLDYTLFPEGPEFYATYRLINEQAALIAQLQAQLAQTQTNKNV